MGEWKNGLLYGQGVQIRSDGNPMYSGQWKGWVRDQGIIITKSGRMSRRESNAFRKNEGAVRDQEVKIPYSGRMH